MNERLSDLSDEALGRHLARALPRHAAPARVRAGVRELSMPRGGRAAWVAPALTAAATALVLLLFVVPLLPRGAPSDPAQRLAQSVVAEHSRTLLWGARRDVVATQAAAPATPLAALEQESGIGLHRAFLGDERLTLVAGEPVYLERRRGLALHYRDADGHLVTYVVLRAPGVTVPERWRVQVDRFKPALLHDNGFAVWVWKQQDLACFLVSDRVAEAELPRLKDYFVRVRTATDPYPVH